MSLSTIGSVKSNLDRLSAESSNDYDTLRREMVESKLYYLRDTNTQAEFDYFVDAELRRGEQMEFGLPIKEFTKRMKFKVRSVFKKKDTTPTICEQLGLNRLED